MKIYPLAEKDNAKKLELVDISGADFNTVHTNDFSFYEHIAEWINEEHVDLLDDQTKGSLHPSVLKKESLLLPMNE
jgi:hypothetical protein